MKKLKFFFYALISASLLIPGVLPAQEEEESAAEPEKLYQNLELFARVIEIIRNNYVEEVLPRELIYGALHGMLNSLDPYSQFMEPDIYNEMKVDTKGEFGGLGIEITLRGGILTIITPIEDTPASRAGLQPGDKIVQIEGESTKEITLLEAVKKLRGEPGTEVQITVMRPGEKEFLEFTITRAIIQIESVKEARMLEDGIGYIRLIQFQQNTAEEFDRALEGLETEDLKGLILDLRYNPGGLLSTAIEIADRFLNKGEVIVLTLSRDDRVEMEVKASGEKKIPDIPLLVLINEGSASGSEIVAGALRDNQRAILVGSKTFGKGSVQSVVPLRGAGSEEGETAIRLTTGHYYTASRNPIHEKGIEPDIEVVMSREEKKEFLLKKYQELEKLEKETEEEEGKEPEAEEEVELKEEEEQVLDPQLRKALDILRGILIFNQLQEQTE